MLNSDRSQNSIQWHISYKQHQKTLLDVDSFVEQLKVLSSEAQGTAINMAVNNTQQSKKPQAVIEALSKSSTIQLSNITSVFKGQLGDPKQYSALLEAFLVKTLCQTIKASCFQHYCGVVLSGRMKKRK